MFRLVSGEVIVGIISIVVAILIGIASFFGSRHFNRKCKTLWHRERSYALVERRRTDERIEILFDGDPVPDVYVSIIGLWYRGTSAIVEDDYRAPVTIDFGDARVLDAEIEDSSPEGLPMGLSVDNPHKVVFSPVALNDNNVVRARVLLTSRRSRPKVTGHIVDVEIRDRWEYNSLSDRLDNGLFAMMITGVGVSMVGAILLLFFSSDNFVPLWIVIIVFGGLGLSMGSTLLMPIQSLLERYQEKVPI